MADTVPNNPTTRHYPQADGGTRGSPQEARPHCPLRPATHPRGRFPGHSSPYATDGRGQDSRSAHLQHPQIPAACSQPAPDQPGPPPQTPVLPTVRTWPATYHPAWDRPNACTPPTRHNTGTAHTSTTATAHTPASMRTPQAPMPPHHRLSIGTANHQPPCAPSVYANGYHRGPYPATRTTGSAWEPHTASPTAPTARTSTPTTARGPQLQTHPPPRQQRPLLRATQRRPLGPPGRLLRGGRSGPPWTIAMATGSAPLPPHGSLPLHSGAGLNVAPRHILLALHLHHRDLHLQDSQLPAPQAAFPVPEAWAETAPEDIVDYL